MSHPNAEAQKSSGGLMEDVIGIFVSPSQVFEHQRNKSFVMPALIQSVVLVGLTFALHNLLQPFVDADFARISARAAAKAAERGQPLPEQAKGMMETMAQVGLYFNAALLPWVGAILGGVLVWLIAKIVGAKMRVGQAMTIVAWAAMPLILSTVAMAVFGVVADAATVRGSGDGQLGALRFVDPDATSPFLTEILRRVDVFFIWEVILCAIGVSVVGAVSRGSGFVVAAIRWALVACVFGVCAGLG